METEQSPPLDALTKLGFVRVGKPPMLEARPRYARSIGTGWHAGMAIALSALALAALIGWMYHEKSQRWV